MSRVIKFRVYNYTIEQMTYDIESIDFSNGVINQINTDIDRILFPDKECVLMQFTNLIDKNGVEIYEGDIIKYDSDDKNIGKIIYIKTAYYISWINHSNSLLDLDDRIEVIGNIYENQELLNGGKEV